MSKSKSEKKENRSEKTEKVAHIETPADRAAVCVEQAKDLTLHGRNSSIELERVLRDIVRALSYDASDAKTYMFLAKVFKTALDMSSAIFCYRFALRLEPSNFAAKKNLCEMLVLHGKEVMVMAGMTGCKSKYTAAIAFFEEALEVNRDDSKIWILKCLCHLHLKELAEAYESINRVIKPNRPGEVETYVLRAKIQWARGLVEQGNADIRVASSIDPNHPEVVSFANRSFVKAEKLYKDGLKAFADKEYKDSLALIKHALFITSDDVKLHIMVAKICRQMGDLQAAYAAILKAKSVFESANKQGDNQFQLEVPSDIVRQVNLILNDMSVKYVMEGDYEKGILLLNKIVKTELSLTRGGLLTVDYKYYVNRGDCYRALHRLDDAIRDYESALEIAPNDWDIKTKLSLTHYLKAADFFNVSDFRGTELQLDKAILYNPKVSEYYAVRGKARYYNNDLVAAYADFKRTLELDKTNTEIKQRLEQFDVDELEASMKPAKEKEILQLSLSIDNLKPRFSSERQVMHLKVSDDDNVAMMLHPRDAKQLPIMKLLTSSADIGRMIQSKNNSDKPPPRIRSDRAFNRAVMATQELQIKDQAMKAEFTNRIDPTKDELWRIVDNAKSLARETSHPEAHRRTSKSATTHKTTTHHAPNMTNVPLGLTSLAERQHLKAKNILDKNVPKV